MVSETRRRNAQGWEMKRFVLAAALAVMPATAEAQYLIDGTDPSAATTIVQNGGYAKNFYQTFTAAGSQLHSLSVWFYGGTYPFLAAEDQYARLYLYDGTEIDSPRLASVSLDQTIQGRFDWVFSDPLQLIIGNAYQFAFFVNNCGSVASGGCGQWGKQPGPAYLEPAIEITTTDAYAGGQFVEGYQEHVNTGRDIRFEMAYVDEPPTGALLGAVVMLLGGMVVRRRRQR